MLFSSAGRGRAEGGSGDPHYCMVSASSQSAWAQPMLEFDPNSEPVICLAISISTSRSRADLAILVLC